MPAFDKYSAILNHRWKEDPSDYTTIIGTWSEDGSTYTIGAPPQLTSLIISLQNALADKYAKVLEFEAELRKLNSSVDYLLE